MDNITINPQKLPPFGKWCVNMGMMPTAFEDALSYEEQLIWLVKYLENSVMPAINNNASALAEVQKLYNEVKTYVDNYFENLDVQTEINTKLDTMATDGTLDKIINQEIFGEINNDISGLQNNISELQNETMKIEGDVASVQADITTINNTLNEKPLWIIIGDSYSVGLFNGNYIKSWVEFLAEHMKWTKNTDYYLYGERRAGFIRTGSQQGNTFITLLNNAYTDLGTNASKVTNILVCGGYNDNPYQFDEINNAIKMFMNSAKEKFPNAEIMLGMISNSINSDPQYRLALVNQILPAWQNVTQYGGIYLNNVENILKNYLFFDASLDPTHPTLLGYQALGDGIYNAIKTGYANIATRLWAMNSNLQNTSNYDITPESNLYNNINFIRMQMLNNITTFYMQTAYAQFNTPINPSNDTIILGTVDLPLYKFTTTNYHFGCIPFHVRTSNDTFYSGTGQLFIDSNNQLILQHKILNADRTGYLDEPIQRITLMTSQWNIPSSRC